MTEEEVFNGLFEQFGGLAKADDIPHLAQLRSRMYESIDIVRITYPKLPHIYINYVASNKVNARITKYEDKYYLGINMGAFFLMRDMFTRMLSHTNILPEIGNALNEAEVTDYLLASIEDGQLSFIVDLKAFSFPKDPVRKLVADYFTNLAFEFLLHHECCHVLRGHLSYVLENSDNSYLYENNDKVNDSKLPSDILQALEMDADSFALNRMFNLFRSFHDGHILASEELKFLYKDYETIVGIITYITYCFFRLFGHNQPKSNEIMLYDHPPISIRMVMVVSNIVSILHPTPNDESKKLDAIITQKMMEAERAFLTITPQYSMWNEDTYPEELATQYMRMLERKWKEIRPDLWPLKYSDTLPE